MSGKKLSLNNLLPKREYMKYPRKLEISAFDYHNGLLFYYDDIIKGLENFCGTQRAYMDRTSEKIVKVEKMINKLAYLVTIDKLK